MGTIGFDDTSKSKIDLESYISSKVDELLSDSSALSKLGITITSSVTDGSTALLTSGGAYNELAKLNSTNTFQSSIYLNSLDASATTQRLIGINDYATVGSWLGNSSYPAQLRNLRLTINPSTHYGYVGLYSTTDSAWEGGLQFGNGQTTFLGRRNINGTVYKTPTVSFNNGSIINVADINGYAINAGCSYGVTASVASGNNNLVTSAGVYTKITDYAFPKAGGTINGASYINGNFSPTSQNEAVLGITDHYWKELRCNTWRSSGTPYWISGAKDQSCIVKSLGLYSLTQNSSNASSSYTYAPVYASAFNQKSSKRYKDHKGYITDEQAKVILDLNPVIYDYKNKDNGTDCEGLYAEDVYKLIPYSVTLNGDNEPDSIDYSRLVPRMIKMIQILENEIKELKGKINN